jgi:Gas vesicle synthesis protein GvpO
MASKNGHVSAPQIVLRAIEQVAELTGRQIEGVNGLERSDDGWVVTLEVVELRRVPDSTDVLGSYAVAVDARGELEGYRRTHRYYRSQVEER